MKNIKKSKGNLIREMNIPLIAKEIGDAISYAESKGFSFIEKERYDMLISGKKVRILVLKK